jgi:hypothetical protein
MQEGNVFDFCEDHFLVERLVGPAARAQALRRKRDAILEAQRDARGSIVWPRQRWLEAADVYAFAQPGDIRIGKRFCRERARPGVTVHACRGDYMFE